jgi:hypothetical protein
VLQSGFSAAAREAEDARGRLQVELAEEVEVACNRRRLRARAASRRLLERGSEGAEKVEEGAQSFIDGESSTGPVHAPCPKRGAAKLGGQTGALR